jgi:2-iminoacetate synthase ThiH
VALSSRIGAASLTAEEALAYADGGPTLAELCERARQRSSSPLVTFSPKVFIPLTHLCRD